MNGLPTPPLRVYGNKNIIMFTCDTSTHKKSSKVCTDVFNCLIDTCRRLQCPSLITSENLPAEDLGKSKEAILENLLQKPDMERMSSEDIRKSHAGATDLKKAFYLTNN